MIRTRDIVPNIYYDTSRDFQFFGRIYEVIFNYIKTNIDLMTSLPLSKNTDLSMINLLLTTIGFTRRHEYNAEDLKKICSVFIELVRLKGTKRAVELAISTLMNAQNIDASFEVVDRYVSNGTSMVKQYSFDIYLPIELEDKELLEDIFDYILPSGYEYRFYYSEYGMSSKTALATQDRVSSYQFSNDNLSMISQPKSTRDQRPEVVGEKKNLGLTYTGVIYNPSSQPQEEEENNG